MMKKMNHPAYRIQHTAPQRGFSPIYIVAGVVILLAVIAAAFQFSFNKKPAPSPTPNAAQTPTTFKSRGCTDMDYTGCDGPEWATWTDDGKR